MNIDSTIEQGVCPAWELVPGDFDPKEREYVSKSLARAALRYPSDITGDMLERCIKQDTVNAVDALIEAKAMKKHMGGNT